MDELLFEGGAGGCDGAEVAWWLLLLDTDGFSLTTDELVEEMGTGDGTRSVSGTVGGTYAGTGVGLGVDAFFDGVGEVLELMRESPDPVLTGA